MKILENKILMKSKKKILFQIQKLEKNTENALKRGKECTFSKSKQRKKFERKNAKTISRK